MDLWHALALAAAAAVAAGVNAAAGGGSLLTFPTLVALGLTPLSANVTNTVGLVPGYLASAVGYRRELAGQYARLRLLSVTAAAGAVVGVVLLLELPSAAFDVIVPALLVVACVLLLLQPRIAAWLRGRRPDPHPDATPAGTHIAVLLGSVYGAYFGGALGVLMLAALGLLLSSDLQRLNALKTGLSVVINTVAAVAFAIFAPVRWADAGVLAVASMAGGFAGASLARRLPATPLRVGVAAVGLAAAGWLAVRAA